MMRKLIPFKENLCSKYATKMISIKINNVCNCHCSFCVDRGGYKANTIDVDAISKEVISLTEYKTVIITGGEPFMNINEVQRLCEKIRSYKNRIVLNTNGSLLSAENVSRINPYIDELQISIHSPNQEENGKVFGKIIDFTTIRETLKEAQFKIVINSTFNRYVTDKEGFFKSMVNLCHYIGAKGLRLTELKKVDEQEFIEAKEFIKHPFISRPSDQLITEGCTSYFTLDGIDVSIKRLCQYAKGSKSKNFSCCFVSKEGLGNIDIDTDDTFKVIYSDGSVFNDWIFSPDSL